MQFEGTHAPTAAEIELESIPSSLPFNYLAQKTASDTNNHRKTEKESAKFTDEQKQKMLDEVEKQQTEFGTQK